MTFEDLWWMQCIMEGRMPNLGSWIIHEIIRITTRRNPVLHFGYAISAMLSNLAPEILEGVESSLPSTRSVLDETTLRKMHYERLPSGEWAFRGQPAMHAEDPQDEPAPPSPPPAPSSEPIPPSPPPLVYTAPSGPFLPHPNEILQGMSEMQQGINFIGRRMTSMEDRMTSMEHNLTSFQHDMNQRALALEIRLNDVIGNQQAMSDTAAYYLRGIAESLQNLGIQPPFQPPPYQPYPLRPTSRAPPHYRPHPPPPQPRQPGPSSARYEPVNLDSDHDED